MRYLWLAFLIGWSGSAYAATGTSPSVDVPITIPSSGPTPPPGAAAAGFTTLAANYDFTQPMSAGWLGCSPDDGNTHQWYQQPNNAGFPCNISQVTDPATGGTVLNLQWLPSYPSAGFQSTMEMRTVSADGTPSRGLDFPNAYYEVVYRVPQNTPENTPSFQPYQAFWVYFRGPAAVEYDFVENYGTLESAAWHDWSRSGAGNSIWNESNLPGFDSTQYHTYAGRITSDGNTATAFCGYVDNVLRGTCQDPGTSVHNSRRFLIINNGPYSNSIPAAMNLYVKTIRVWSCASWQTTMCNGTVLTTAP